MDDPTNIIDVFTHIEDVDKFFKVFFYKCNGGIHKWEKIGISCYITDIENKKWMLNCVRCKNCIAYKCIKIRRE